MENQPKKRGAKKGRAGGNLNGGRRKVENPVLVQVTIETEVAERALQMHGSYPNAIMFAAENKPKDGK